jgi:DNA-binding beta-propeller fold protein YncE
MQETGRLALIHKDEVSEVELGGSPHDVKGVGKVVIVANEGASRLDIVSLRGRLLRSISLQADPHDIAIAPGAPVIWASLDGTDEMARVDLRRGVTYVPTGKRPHDLLFAPDGRLWVTDWGGALHVLERGRIEKSIPLGIEAHHLAFTPDGKEAWITDHGAHKVFVLDVESVEVLAELPIHGAPHHVAITPNGRWAVVADHDNGTLVVFSVAEWKQVGEIEVGPRPHGVWVQP